MSIPSTPTFTSIRSRKYNLDTTGAVNSAIDDTAQDMEDLGWTRAGLFASTTMQLGLPFVGSLSGFSLIFTDYFGQQVQLYNSLSDGLVIQTPTYYPVDTVSASSSDDIVVLICAAMMDIKPEYVAFGIDPGSIGQFTHIQIVAVDPGAFWNDQGPIALNILTGGIGLGSPKGGGWIMTSDLANGQSAVVVQLTNNFLDCLTLQGTLSTNVTSEIMIEKRVNYLSVVSPYAWELIRRNDGSGYSNGTIFPQHDNYQISAPNVDAGQLTDPVNPTTYFGIVWVGPRTQLNLTADYVAVAVNTTFAHGSFGAFNADIGISLFVINSMFDGTGALKTTTDAAIQTQAILGVSEAAGEPLEIIGDFHNMFITSECVPLDTPAYSRTGEKVIAFRSQQGPDATLWLALE